MTDNVNESSGKLSDKLEEILDFFEQIAQEIRSKKRIDEWQKSVPQSWHDEIKEILADEMELARRESEQKNGN